MARGYHRSMPGQPSGPLAGVRVVDCSTVLAGPYATMLLADLGADVIKIEPPEGDSTRGWGPPWVGDEADGTKTAAYFLAVNRNKRSLRLDLKRPPGADVLRRLLATADVFVENLRPDSLERLGFGDDALEAINPRLIHLSVSGYGPTGPLVGRPGYDFLLQAETGLMSITGAADADGGRPTKVGVAIADVATGLHGAVGILAALAGRDREGSPAHGTGQRVDVSIFESTLSVLVNQAQNAFVDGVAPGRLGNAHPNIVPYETFETADGEIAIAVGSERQWHRFCLAIGLPALADDPRFDSNGDRVTNRDELLATLRERLAERSSVEWLAALDASDIPAGPINDIPTAFASRQAEARRMAVEVDHPALGRTTQVGLPFVLSVTPAEIRSAPPLLGEHADEILAEAGYSPEEIASLRGDGVI
jgi:crotonobetainyl-CoA:carnitine CoA-transferase CaiB-like acyl-CoA transferase